jgi:hypothetical protein
MTRAGAPGLIALTALLVVVCVAPPSGQTTLAQRPPPPTPAASAAPLDPRLAKLKEAVAADV